MSNEFLSTTSPGWPAMWEALADATGDYADCNPESGECWQYMGTYDGAHQFRHRHRPITARAIKGFAEPYYDRVNLHLDSTTLKVKRVGCQKYGPVVSIPAGLADSRAIGERTEAGREANRLALRGNSYDFEPSDADPGL